MDDYKITRTRKTCGACEKVFSEGDCFFSAVEEIQEGFMRRDYCLDCWKSVREEERSGFFSFWRAAIRPKSAPGRRKLDLETAREFFTRLHGTAEPQKQTFIYLLTLLMLRKRALVQKNTLRDGGEETLVLHFPHEEDTLYHVKVPLLDESAMDAVREDFSNLLDLDL